MNEDKCKSLSETLDNAILINGDGTDRELLESEHIRDHDVLICLTDRDEENLVTGLYGVKLGMRKVIVKINRLETMDIIGDMGIDSIVSPKLATANVIMRAVRARSHSQNSVIEKVYPLLAEQAEAYEFVALPGGSYLNIPLNKLGRKHGVLVSMIVRGRQIIIPFGSDHIEAGDTVILTALAGTIADLKDAFDTTEK